MPTDTLTCHPQRRWKGEFLRRRVCDPCKMRRRKSRAQVIEVKKQDAPTDGGRLLAEQLNARLLERKVNELSVTVEMLSAFIGKEDLAAAQRLKKITPDSATLRLWVDRADPPEDLANEREERPW